VQYKLRLGTIAGTWKVVVTDKKGKVKCVKVLELKKIGNDFLVLNKLNGIRGYHWLEIVHDEQTVYRTSRPVKFLSRNKDGVIPKKWITTKPAMLPRGKAAWKNKRCADDSDINEEDDMDETDSELQEIPTVDNFPPVTQKGAMNQVVDANNIQDQQYPLVMNMMLQWYQMMQYYTTMNQNAIEPVQKNLESEDVQDISIEFPQSPFYDVEHWDYDPFLTEDDINLSDLACTWSDL
jgi:hypothetical protein